MRVLVIYLICQIAVVCALKLPDFKNRDPDIYKSLDELYPKKKFANKPFKAFDFENFKKQLQNWNNGKKGQNGKSSKERDSSKEMDIKKELTFYSAPEHCKPICPCIMDGITYDHGDEWKDKLNPCITYRCGNGFYEAVKRGAMFNGECKELGSTWTQECFTYQTQLIEGSPTYRLIQAGCRDEEGNCWKVGDQFRHNCNTYECQIVGTCYQITTVAKGCKFDDDCKPVKHFWHDGCNIFQCMENNGRVGYEKVANEMMYWPSGNYAMLKPKTGCPVDINEVWSDGFRSHMGSLKNYVSYKFDAFGIYTNYVFVQHFCVHQQLNDPTLLPRYQTYWEPGKYCILRKNGTCPYGFMSGFVGFDDLDMSEHLSMLNGTLPDGQYDKDTGFYFCCRNDGKSDVPLVLPKQRPFILFPSNEAEDCQEVRGMSHTLEYFAFDDTDGNPPPAMNGSIPLTKDGDNNTEVYFCHYKPMDCGCDDGKGNVIPVGKTFMRDCAEYICREDNGKQILDVKTGGCKDDQGKCRKENDIWIESYGETCASKRCSRSDNGIKVKFEARMDYKGCKEDENECRPVNYHVQRGCYNSVCSFDAYRQTYFFKMVKAGCSDGKGGCIPVGKEFTKNCMTYKCETETYKCGMKFIKGACKYGDACHNVGSVWQHSACHKLKCSMTKKKSSVQFSIDSVEQSCSYNGKCYKAGRTVSVGCYTKQCFVNTDQRVAYMDIVNGGCKYRDRCMAVNQTWTDGCTQYVCLWHKNGLQHSFEHSIKSMKCQFGDECVEAGGFRKRGCVEYECKITKKNNAQFGKMEPISYACKDRNGNCLSVNEEIEEKCCLYRCMKKDNLPFPRLEKVGGGCEVNGVCKDVDSIWTDSDKCVDYKCVEEVRNNKVYMVTTPVGVGCKQGGVCRTDGEKWPVADQPCFLKQCIVTKKDSGFSRMLKTLPRGCMVDGICREFGFVNYEGCIQYSCVWDEENRYASYKYTKGGCKEYTSSKCHDVGETWTEKYGQITCLQMTCQQNGNRFGLNIQYTCQDVDGNCVQPGNKFEAKNYYGRRVKNCKCQKTGNGVKTVCPAS